jgi:small subunit ribosomal protein S12
MVTFNQLRKKIRGPKLHKTRTPALLSCPQKVGIVFKIGIVKPKKPNSAQRKVAWVKLKHRNVISYIPGQGHNIQSTLMSG